MTTLQFYVQGVPVGKGSMKAFMPRGGKFPIVTNDSTKTKPWQSSIAFTAAQKCAVIGWQCVQGNAVAIDLTFNLPRPRGHYGTGKHAEQVRSSAPQEHVTKPDIDKLVRCALDALKGIVWRDDCQVVTVRAHKSYGLGGHTGLSISLDALPGKEAK